MKKKICFCIAAAMTAVCACDHKNEVAAPFHGTKTEVVSFSIGESCFATKAGGATHTADEAKINDLQVLVFNPDGSLNGYGRSSDNSCDVRVTRGTAMRCYAVVNAGNGSFGDISDEQSLRTSVSDMSDNRKDSFHMFGTKTQDMTTGNNFAVPVSRMASKVTLGSVTNEIESDALAGKDFNVTGIYLINACGSCTLEKTPLSSGKWLNMRKYENADNANGFLGARGTKTAVAAGTVSFDRDMYCYPNPVLAQNDANSADGAFTPRLTRLVIEAEIGTDVYYYPVNIHSKGTSLLANKHYTVSNVVITGPGSKSPDIIPDIDNVKFSVEVQDWDEEEIDEVVF